VSDPLNTPWSIDAEQYRLETFPSAATQARVLQRMKDQARLVKLRGYLGDKGVESVGVPAALPEGVPKE
jgi:hypothetical protein